MLKKCYFVAINLLVFWSFSVASTSLLADFNEIQTIVNNYNSLNGGNGTLFSISVSSNYTKANGSVYQGETRVNLINEIPSLNAYSSLTSGNGYFQTFCIQTQEMVESGMSYYSQLSLEGNSTSAYSTTLGLGAQSLTEGTALLYRLFATGNLADYNYSYGTARADDALILQEAFWKLQQQTISNVGALTDADWTNNKYLAYLKTVDSSKDWLQTYDPARDTSGYAVLAMQNMGAKLLGAQDFLYLTRTSHGNGVPEPATVCFWLAATGGMIVCRRRKKRNLSC